MCPYKSAPQQPQNADYNNGRTSRVHSTRWAIVKLKFGGEDVNISENVFLSTKRYA